MEWIPRMILKIATGKANSLESENEALRKDLKAVAMAAIPYADDIKTVRGVKLNNRMRLRRALDLPRVKKILEDK